MANVVTDPTADQSIVSYNLLAATGNTTQSVGSAAAPWNAVLNQAQIATSLALPYNQTIVLSGSVDPYGGSIQMAIDSLQSGGGIVDARAFGVSLVSQGSVDPGSQGVTILLGPWTYIFTSITLRNDLHIVGSGAQNCIIKVSSQTTTALFLGPGSAGVNVTNCLFEGFSCYGPDGQSSMPLNYNSLHCFFLDASAASDTLHGGVWNSVWRGVAVFGFGGCDWYFKGGSASGNPGFHQYNSLYDCTGWINQGLITAFSLSAAANASGGNTVYTGTITGGGSNPFVGVTFAVTGFDNAANSGTFLCVASTAITLTLVNPSGVSDTHSATATGTGSGQVLRLEGNNYQLSFFNVTIQSPTGNGSVDTSSGTNALVYIGSGPGLSAYSFPYGMQFYGCNVNGREILIQIDGGQDISIRKTHSEMAYIFCKVTYGLGGGWPNSGGTPIPTGGVVIADCSFNGNVGINSGNGAILDIDSSAVGNVNGIWVNGCMFNAPHQSSPPDNWVAGGVGAPYVLSDHNWIVTNAGTANALMAGGGACPVVVATVHLTGNTESTGSVPWFTPSISGLYRFSGSVETTVAGSSGTVTWGIAGYTNRHGSSSQNPASGSALLTSAGYEQSGTVTVYCTAGNTVSYEATVTNGVGAQYAVDLIAEYLG